MCEKVIAAINEIHLTRYNEAIARRDEILAEQMMLRNRWRGNQ